MRYRPYGVQVMKDLITHDEFVAMCGIVRYMNLQVFSHLNCNVSIIHGNARHDLEMTLMSARDPLYR